MYMAFWVKGSIKGMIEGKVSRRWAKKHHPRWYREVEAAEEKTAAVTLLPPGVRDGVGRLAFSQSNYRL